MTIQELTTNVQTKALTYLNEMGETRTAFPLSIVDFVIEYAINESHFPNDYKEEQICSRMQRVTNTLAMACIEVYSKAGAEGETSHNENAISRNYERAWISPILHDVLPNYVGVI